MAEKDSNKSLVISSKDTCLCNENMAYCQDKTVANRREQNPSKAWAEKNELKY